MEIMDYCQKVGEEAYVQECARKKAIDMKCDYLFKWLTLLTAIFNIAVPIIVQSVGGVGIDTTFWGLYGSLMVLLVVAMVMMILANFPQKNKMYPLGYEMLKDIKINTDKYVDEEDVKYQTIMFRDAVTTKMIDNNNRTVIYIGVAYICIAIALVLMAFFFGYIMWGM